MMTWKGFAGLMLWLYTPPGRLWKSRGAKHAVQHQESPRADNGQVSL